MYSEEEPVSKKTASGKKGKLDVESEEDALLKKVSPRKKKPAIKVPKPKVSASKKFLVSPQKKGVH